ETNLSEVPVNGALAVGKDGLSSKEELERGLLHIRNGVRSDDDGSGAVAEESLADETVEVGVGGAAESDG
ncbi:hypothetical protein KI387_006397, partial [Taxus chinensis]